MRVVHHIDGDPYSSDPRSLRVLSVMMNRNSDCATSITAASTVSRRMPTLRQRVEDFAKRLPYGFIDDDLRLIDPDGPESSLRKRRTELVADRIIIPSEETRKNRAGMPCTVFYHRTHVINPPPIKERQEKPSKHAALLEENARLRAEIDRVRNQLDEARGW